MGEKALIKLSKDLQEFLFRALFCLIFVGLGAEHLFSDTLIQKLMPTWVPFPRLISFLCGAWLFFWGSLILLGWQLRAASIALGVFLIGVTLAVHVPGVVSVPAQVFPEDQWMWIILQRTNLVKNLCLLGVCFHLFNHELGRYSLTKYFKPSPN